MFELVDAEKANYPVAVLCEVLEVSRSGFYARKTRPTSARSRADAQLAVEIAAAHRKSGRRYGSPRVHRALRKRGVRVGKKRVERLMRDGGLVGRRKRPFRHTTDSRHASPIAPNVVARDFEPSAPNRRMGGRRDLHRDRRGLVLPGRSPRSFSRRVVGWAMSATNDTALALAALERGIRSRHVVLPGLVHHSDRGSPYASDDYRAALAARGMVASMSRRGDCWDNAVAESFFATLRAELVDDEHYASRDAAEASISDYIERFYNVERLHSHLDYVSPIEFELRTHVTTVAA